MKPIPDEKYIAAQAEACQRLWRAVIINAVRSVSAVEHVGATGYRRQVRVCTKEELRQWLDSPDGDEALELAGYEPRPELKDRLMRAARDPGEDKSDSPVGLTICGGPKRGAVRSDAGTQSHDEEPFGDEFSRPGRPISLSVAPWEKAPAVPVVAGLFAGRGKNSRMVRRGKSRARD